MTKDELIQLIQPCIGENSGIEIYFGLENGECRKGNFANAVQGNLKDLFVESLNTKVISEDITLLDLSAADDRKNAIYYYDIQHEGNIQGMEWMYEVCNPQNNIPVFSFDEDGIENIDYFLIKLATVDNQLVIYRNLPSINNYKKQSAKFIWGRNNIFEEMPNDFLKISPGVEILKIGNEFIVTDMKFFERAFGFHDPIKRAAHTQIIRLATANLLDGVEKLDETVDNDVSIARKLSNLEKNSPVLKIIIDGGISNETFIRFTKTNPALAGKFKYSEHEDKIAVKTKKHIKYLLKVLNDDYLMSELTKNQYDSSAKDPVLLPDE